MLWYCQRISQVSYEFLQVVLREYFLHVSVASDAWAINFTPEHHQNHTAFVQY